MVRKSRRWSASALAETRSWVSHSFQRSRSWPEISIRQRARKQGSPHTTCVLSGLYSVRVTFCVKYLLVRHGPAAAHVVRANAHRLTYGCHAQAGAPRSGGAAARGRVATRDEEGGECTSVSRGEPSGLCPVRRRWLPLCRSALATHVSDAHRAQARASAAPPRRAALGVRARANGGAGARARWRAPASPRRGGGARRRPRWGHPAQAGRLRGPWARRRPWRAQGRARAACSALLLPRSLVSIGEPCARFAFAGFPLI